MLRQHSRAALLHHDDERAAAAVSFTRSSSASAAARHHIPPTAWQRPSEPSPLVPAPLGVASVQLHLIAPCLAPRRRSASSATAPTIDGGQRPDCAIGWLTVAVGGGGGGAEDDGGGGAAADGGNGDGHASYDAAAGVRLREAEWRAVTVLALAWARAHCCCRRCLQSSFYTCTSSSETARARRRGQGCGWRSSCSSAVGSSVCASSPLCHLTSAHSSHVVLAQVAARHDACCVLRIRL